MGRNLIVTGLPRGGTTLACRLIGGLEGTVSLFEPMRVERLTANDPAAAAAHVVAFFASTRAQLQALGTAPSKIRDGVVPDNPFDGTSPVGRRRLNVQEGVLVLPAPPAEGFTLAVKHNAAFTALLEPLRQSFEVIAVVRHPLAVLASWHSLDLPVSLGRLPAGERLDYTLARALDQEPDLVNRQLTVLDWFFGRYAALAEKDVLRYEDMVATNGAALAAKLGLRPVVPLPLLQDRNDQVQCSPDLLPGLAARLLHRGGAWTRWYAADTVAPLLLRMQRSA